MWKFFTDNKHGIVVGVVVAAILGAIATQSAAINHKIITEPIALSGNGRNKTHLYFPFKLAQKYFRHPG